RAITGRVGLSLLVALLAFAGGARADLTGRWVVSDHLLADFAHSGSSLTVTVDPDGVASILTGSVEDRDFRVSNASTVWYGQIFPVENRLLVKATTSGHFGTLEPRRCQCL